MAIAFDVAANSSTTAASLTYSHTVTGSNPYLVVFTQQDSVTQSVTGVTYNAVAMLDAGSVTGPTGTTGISHAWVLGNPSTGANNVIVSASASINLYAISLSYTGAQSGSTPDGSQFTTTTASATQVSTITSVADNCWMVQMVRVSAQTLSVSTNCTYRTNSTPFATIKAGDSNGVIHPAASFSMTQTCTADNGALAAVTIAPFSAPTRNSNFLAFM